MTQLCSESSCQAIADATGSSLIRFSLGSVLLGEQAMNSPRPPCGGRDELFEYTANALANPDQYPGF